MDLQPGNLDFTCSASKAAPAGPCESPVHEVSEAAARSLEVDIMNPADGTKAPAEAVRVRVKDVADEAHTR